MFRRCVVGAALVVVATVVSFAVGVGPVAATAPQTGATPPSASGDHLCDAAAQSLSSYVTIEQIAKAVQPAGAQVAKLEALKSVLENTEKDLAASCAGQAPLTAVGRLYAAETRLQAMVKATEAVSGPLDDFYASLSGEQKARFDVATRPPAPGELNARL